MYRRRLVACIYFLAIHLSRFIRSPNSSPTLNMSKLVGSDSERLFGHNRHICLKHVKRIRAGTATLKCKCLTMEDLCIPVIKAVQNSHDA